MLEHYEEGESILFHSVVGWEKPQMDSVGYDTV